MDSEQIRRALPVTPPARKPSGRMNRVTVSNVMKDLRNKGLIDYSYGIVTVRNRDGLMELLPL